MDEQQESTAARRIGIELQKHKRSLYTFKFIKPKRDIALADVEVYYGERRTKANMAACGSITKTGKFVGVYDTLSPLVIKDVISV